MASVKRARGKRSFAIGDRSGFKVPYTSLKTTWDGLRVEPDDWEPKHPQLTPAKNVVDATALLTQGQTTTQTMSSSMLATIMTHF